jgi:FKBP-type peptidyl-prolyl cis-trans isomerase FklB
MKSNFKIIILFVLFLQTLNTLAQNKPAAKAKAPVKAVPAKPATAASPRPSSFIDLKSSIDSLSYAIGVNVGENLKKQNININSAVLARAIEQVIKDQNLLIPADACNSFIQSYFMNEMNKKGESNKQKSESFLAANKTKPGVITTATGLQYSILNAGNGELAKETDKVKVHYHGTLIDGTVFDSSVNRGEPATFGVTQVIKGWVEALQLMPVGSKWRLYIPADLAYGLQGPPSIGPNQALIFDVELLEIVK